MKEPRICTAIAAAVAVIFAFALHALGLFSSIEGSLLHWLAPNAERAAPWILQFLWVGLIAYGVAWFTVRSERRDRAGLVVLGLLVELVAFSWICGWYRIGLQPLPGIFAAIAAYLSVFGVNALPEQRFRAPRLEELVPDDLPRNGSAPQEHAVAHVAAPEPLHTHGAREFEATVLVCDLANKYDLIDTLEPSGVAQACDRFTGRVREILLRAGAHIHSSDQEGVVAIFGFNDGAADHAIRALRSAFELTQALSVAADNGNGFTPGDAQVGLDSGTLITALRPGKNSHFLLGESLELARRFALSNRVYGSRILIGPRSFELTNNAYVSRPIDFLSGVTAQERHEVYEPLGTAADAPKDLVTRRDHFWNGVVLYREKRWGEAYAEFQKARSEESGEDAPLHMYLRRLEPLAVDMAETV
ncbi:MAG: hypothetical protein ABI839_04340 [Verrucomicrobiota bacterium]